MAELIALNHDVRRTNTEPPASEFVENEVTLRWARVRHYVGLRSKIRSKLSSSPVAPILWASISPAALGHFRDMIAVAPRIPAQQPVVGIVHRSGYDQLFRSPLTYPTANILARRLSAFVFLNDGLSLDCARWIPESKRRVIPNTIDEALIFDGIEISKKEHERTSSESIRLLFLSNMIPLKGYMDVLRAVALLLSRGKRIKADFVGRWGSEDDRNSFEHVVETNGLNAVVHYHGGVDNRERVKEFYRNADVFVLPSYHPTEAQPVALIEAMNAGLPIITTRHGGIPSMFEEDEALYVPAQSPKAICSAVERLFDADTLKAYSARSRRTYEKRFSPEVVLMQWESLLHDIANERPVSIDPLRSAR